MHVKRHVLFIQAGGAGVHDWASDELRPAGDLGARLPHGMRIHIYHGLDDSTAPPSHAELYARAIPQAHVHCMPGRDHPLNDDLGEVAAAIESSD